MSEDAACQRCDAFKVRLDAMEKMANEREKMQVERIKSTQDALVLASNALDKRLDGMNEFRATLTDQNRNFITHTEYSAKHEALAEKVNLTMSRLLTIETRLATHHEGISATMAIIVGGASVISMLISLAVFVYSIIHH